MDFAFHGHWLRRCRDGIGNGDRYSAAVFAEFERVRYGYSALLAISIHGLKLLEQGDYTPARSSYVIPASLNQSQATRCYPALRLLPWGRRLIASENIRRLPVIQSAALASSEVRTFSNYRTGQRSAPRIRQSNGCAARSRDPGLCRAI